MSSVHAASELEARPPKALLKLLAWYVLWRLPFWRALPDFFDSPEFIWRVNGGFWSGLHNAGGHLPFQGTEYGPAGALFTAMAGRWSEVTCMAVVSAGYGLLAYVALIVLWRRLFSERIAWLAALLYPLLSGPGLADTSTYSMSALQAFLFGGSALYAEGLVAANRAQLHSRVCLALGALCTALGVYTHPLAVIWLTVPLGVGAAYAAGALRVDSETVSPWPQRRATLLRATLLAAGACALGLLIAGAEVAHVHRAESVLGGVSALLFRSWGWAKPPLDAERLQYLRRGLTQVTGGLGLVFLIVGWVRHARRDGRWSAVTGILHLVSLLLLAREFVWGFNGRLYLPVLGFGVPMMVEAAQVASSGRVARLGEAALLSVLLLQSTVTTLGVLGSRRLGPHPDEGLLPATREMTRDGDGLVIDADHRTYAVNSEHLLWFYGVEGQLPELDSLREDLTFNGKRLFGTSEAWRRPLRLRDGHLVSATNFRVNGAEVTALMHDASERAAVVLDRPLGREEFIFQLTNPEDAPSLSERVHRADAFLDSGEALLVVAGEREAPALAGAIYGTARDCLSRERYDSWEFTALGPALAGKCEPLELGITDVTRLWMQPLPIRSHYRLELRRWAYELSLAEARQSVELGARLEPMSRGEAAQRLARESRPFAAVIEPVPEGVLLDIEPLSAQGSLPPGP